MKTQTNKQLLLKKATNTKASSLPVYDLEWQEWMQALSTLNDAFRLAFTSSELYCSPDFLKIDHNAHSAIFKRVRGYRNFNEDNDPSHDHSRGFFEYEGVDYVWEIVYLTPDGNDLSANYLNLDLTCRCMMITTQDEWWDNLPN